MPAGFLLFQYLAKLGGDFLRRKPRQTLERQESCFIHFTALQSQGGGTPKQDRARRLHSQSLKKGLCRFTFQLESQARQSPGFNVLAIEICDLRLFGATHRFTVSAPHVFHRRNTFT